MTVFWITVQVVTTLCDYRAVFQIMLALSCTLITTYNSRNLQVSLAERGIWCLETVYPNHLPNCQLPADTVLKKHGRGSRVEKVAEVRNMKMSAVQWYDNRPVTFLSTFVGVGAEPLVTKHMGGVDLLDSLTGLIGAGLDPRNGTIAYFFTWLMLLWLMHG